MIPETYDEWCKLKCPEGCGKEFPPSYGMHWTNIQLRQGFQCPCSRDAYEAELVAALKGMTREWRIATELGVQITGTTKDPATAKVWANYWGFCKLESRLVSPWEPEKQKEQQ